MNLARTLPISFFTIAAFVTSSFADDMAKPKAPATTPTPPVTTPAPAVELAELASGLAGSWACTGKVTMDGKMIETKGTMVNKVDLDKWWIQTSFSATMGKQTYKFTAFTSYNQVEKKFVRFMFDNMGGSESAMASAIDHGMADKWGMTWEGDSKLGVTMAGAPKTMKTRHVESVRDKGKELTMSGEMSVDGGKTWLPSYTSTCKTK